MTCTKVLIDKYYQTNKICQKSSYYNIKATDVEAVWCNLCAERVLGEDIVGKVCDVTQVSAFLDFRSAILENCHKCVFEILLVCYPGL